MLKGTWYPEDYWSFGKTWIRSTKTDEIQTLWFFFVGQIFSGIVLMYGFMFLWRREGKFSDLEKLDFLVKGYISN